MQVVMNKCFPVNLGKSLAQIRLVVFEKNVHYNSEKRRHRAEGYSNDQLNCYQVKSQFQSSGSLKLTFNLLQIFNWLLE